MPIKNSHSRVVVTGAGFSGLSCACHLAKRGYKVTVLEKNDQPGGRARVYSEKGFTWDMGPSWYWMPDVFESFFNTFGKTVADYYQLERLDPSYRVKFRNDVIDVPANMEALEALFVIYATRWAPTRGFRFGNLRDLLGYASTIAGIKTAAFLSQRPGILRVLTAADVPGDQIGDEVGAQGDKIAPGAVEWVGEAGGLAVLSTASLS